MPGTMFEEYRREAVEHLQRGDPRSAHRWAKGWIGSGGGARTVEPWLVYVAAGVQEGKPRHAVRAVDQALRHWITDPPARAILRYVRGEVVRRHLQDPKTALGDLEAAGRDAPRWLAELMGAARARCEEKAGSSRKRTPSVGTAPAYEGTTAEVPPTPALDYALADSPPPIWATFHHVLAG